jgi:hypothetical protein
MAAAIVGAFVIGIVLMGVLFLSIIGVASFVAPFSGGALFSVMICEVVPGAKHIVPGHSFLNYLVILLIVETIIVFLIRIPQISMPMNVLLTSFFICCIGLLFLYPVHTKSVGLCVFLTVVYLVAAAVILSLNIQNWDFDEGDCNIFFRILASLIYAFSGIIMAIPLAGGMWQNLYGMADIYSWIGVLVTIGAAVVGGVVGWIETD